jgi:hypothetical protein
VANIDVKIGFCGYEAENGTHGRSNLPKVPVCSGPRAIERRSSARNAYYKTGNLRGPRKVDERVAWGRISVSRPVKGPSQYRSVLLSSIGQRSIRSEGPRTPTIKEIDRIRYVLRNDGCCAVFASIRGMDAQRGSLESFCSMDLIETLDPLNRACFRLVS